jgi:hypothetical protein
MTKAMLNDITFKKPLLEKNQTWKETIDWLMKKYWFHLN